MSDEKKDSQQEPEQDSALQTPQPDQPHPPVSNRRYEDGPEDSQPVHVDVQREDGPDVSVDIPAAPAEQSESD
jgi:hypothetical protein